MNAVLASQYVFPLNNSLFCAFQGGQAVHQVLLLTWKFTEKYLSHKLNKQTSNQTKKDKTIIFMST